MGDMAYVILIVEETEQLIEGLAKRDAKRYRKVIKALALLGEDPAYPSLHSHRFESLDQVFGEKIWESYVENKAPSAWRMWWFYGPEQGDITVVLIAAHP